MEIGEYRTTAGNVEEIEIDIFRHRRGVDE